MALVVFVGLLCEELKLEMLGALAIRKYLPARELLVGKSDNLVVPLVANTVPDGQAACRPMAMSK